MAIDYVFSITREYLFKLIAENFQLIDQFLVLKQNRQFIIEVFSDSARISKQLENDISSGDNFSFSSFNDYWKSIVISIGNDSFRQFIDNAIRKKVYDKLKGISKDTYKSIVISIFKEMAAYHNKIIESNFAAPWFGLKSLTNSNDVPQTFLSYAYFDKGISLGLYLYFQINGGFLYVNWMWSGTNPSPITKQQLNDELGKSNQFLFLRTLNSELDYYGNSHIRQWCSWEIGNYYTKNSSQKYYLNFYGKMSKNDLLSTFSIFRYVKDGIING